MTSAFPGFLLYSPSVADLDKNSSSLELVIGSSAGQLHVINVITGRNIEGFPIPGDTIFGQVTFDMMQIILSCMFHFGGFLNYSPRSWLRM